MTCNTAVLMPTYGRPDCVKDTLSACLELYKKYNFDVYVFDHNGDNETQDIVLELQKSHDNLYYIRMCEFIHIDCKWLDMVRGFYLKKDYDYIYPCGDANSLTEFSLSRIMPYLQKGVDIVNIHDIGRINKTTEFHSANDYFQHPTFNIGLWAGAVYNYKRLFKLTDTEWNKAIAKWFKKDFEFLGLNGFILERISLCDNPWAVEPSMEGAERAKVLRRSKYKKGSFWRLDALTLLCITYPKVYKNLPDCYTNTEEKLKKKIESNFQEPFFWYLKRNGRFNLSDYFYYDKVFKQNGLKILNHRLFLMSILPGRGFFHKLIQHL